MNLIHQVGETLGLLPEKRVEKRLNPHHEITLVLTPGTVWTGVSLPSGGTKMVEAFAFHRTSGKFLDVGTCSQILSKHELSECNLVDLRRLAADDCFVTPGFHDNHVHLVIGGHLKQGVSFEGVTTKAVFVSKLALYYSKWKFLSFYERHHNKVSEKDRKHPEDQDWILGAMVDQERLGRDLDKHIIDSVVKKVPVLIFSSDLHAAIANTAALKLIGIDKTTEAPEGGYIEKTKDGEPTGMLRDSAIGLIQSHIPHHHLLSAVFHSEEDIASLGVTSVSHMGAGPGMYVHKGGWKELKVLEHMVKKKKPRIRVYAAIDLCNHSDLRLKLDEEAHQLTELREQDRYLRPGLLKGYMDGACGSATALIFEHYQGGKRNPEESHFPHGKRVVPLDELSRDIRAAIGEGLNIAVHAIGNRACHEIIEVYEEIVKEHNYRLEPHRLRIEHLQHISEEDLDRLERLKDCVSVCINPTHLVSGVEEFKELLRPEDYDQMKNLYRGRSILDRGIIVSFGSDWPIMSASPLKAIECAVHRIPKENSKKEAFLPQERITVDQALCCLTVNAAKMNGTSKFLGRIEEGMFADFTILNKNILLHFRPEDLHNTKVLMTVVNARTTVNHLPTK